MSQSAEDRLDGPLVKLIIVMALASVTATLNATIVGVGLSPLAQNFDTTLTTAEWVITGYLLAVAATIPVTGWAVDHFGGKRVWLIGLVIYTLTAIGSALSWNIGSLIVFRILQGVAAGIIEPVMMTLTARAAGPARLGRVMGLLALPMTLGPVIGPILGGVIADNLHWSWLFLVNVPIVVTALVFSVKVVPADAPAAGDRATFDVLGTLLLSPGFAVLVYGLSQSAHQGFGSTTVIVSLLLGAALVAGFVVHALTTRRQPLIDVRLFASRGFTAAVIAMALTGAAVFSLYVLLPLYQQQVHGQSLMASGLLLAPFGVGTFLGMPLAGRLSDRIGANLLVPLGATLVVLGILGNALSDASTNQVLLGLYAVVAGLGLGCVGAPTLASLYRTVPLEKTSGATSTMLSLNQVGGSFGVALVALLIQRGIANGQSVRNAYSTTFWWELAITAVIVAVGLALPGRPKPVAAAAPTESPAQESTTTVLS
ncbi:DHA2 family efflux MFS transporter permease subunit [Peterkaempfera bronchialis]|uniref:MFS transporter n=1 Tax=Peterkaempfera bronchialis TaxID=2126346 RepID=A0A345T2L0_9ACTN|nr:DHA2 family efflux MFS transporter permease subunit [Peterkaempfera bronchialis]AXI80215.1 MFS transporter [Peterkaempfera bronchialis]